MTHVMLLGALVVTHAMVQHLTNWRAVITNCLIGSVQAPGTVEYASSISSLDYIKGETNKLFIHKV